MALLTAAGFPSDGSEMPMKQTRHVIQDSPVLLLMMMMMIMIL